MTCDVNLRGLGRFGVPGLHEFSSDEEWEWANMPDYNSNKGGGIQVLIVHFETQADVDEFAKLVDQKISSKTKAIWYPAKPRENMIKWVYINEQNL